RTRPASGLLWAWYGKEEDASLAHFTFYVNTPAVFLDKFFAKNKAETRAFFVAGTTRGIGSGFVEKDFDYIVAHAYSVIAHGNKPLLVACLGGDCHLSAFVGEFDGVGHEVAQDQVDGIRVCVGYSVFRNLVFDLDIFRWDSFQ